MSLSPKKAHVAVSILGVKGHHTVATLASKVYAGGKTLIA